MGTSDCRMPRRAGIAAARGAGEDAMTKGTMTVDTIIQKNWPRTVTTRVHPGSGISTSPEQASTHMDTLRPVPLAVATMLACVLAGCTSESPTQPDPQQARTPGPDAGLVAHGEYIVRIAGCNDCHTEAFTTLDGEVPLPQWLTGSALGYNGPWGTTYATNLRLTIADLEEQEWLDYTATLHTRPIMPDFMLREMREQDRRAIWHFVRSLGPAGHPAPKALPPGETPPPPYFQLVLPPAADNAAPG